MNDLLRFNSLIKTLGGRSLYLVGMMGSGKSKSGPYIAKALQYSFVDQDQLIEKVTKNSISQIFNETGESHFRDIETQVLKEIGKQHSLVVATGGGVVTRSENWGILHQGIVIWIDPSRDCLIKRLKVDSINRPLLSDNDIIQTIDLLTKERYRFYVESDVRISVEEETPQEVALKILEKLQDVVKAH